MDGETDGVMDQGRGRDTGPGAAGSWTASNALNLRIQPMVQCSTAREVLKVEQTIVVIMGLNFLGAKQEPV